MAHKQPTLVRDECQPPAVAEFDGGFASSASPNRGRDCAAVAAATRLISSNVPCGTGETPAVRHTSRRRRGLPHLRAFSPARGKGKSDATLEFAADLPRPRSRYGGTCMWLGAVCRPARQDRGTDDADRRDHAGRRSKGHRAGPLSHGARGRARAGGAGSKARSRSSPCTRGRTGTFGFNGPAHGANRRRAHQGGGPCSRKAASSRAAMTTMMMTTERGSPAPSLPAALQLGGHAGAPSVPSACTHPSDQERQPHQQRAAESDKSNHRPIVEIVAGQLAAHWAFGTGSMGGHVVRTAWFEFHCR